MAIHGAGSTTYVRRKRLLRLALTIGLALGGVVTPAGAAQVVIPGPAGSGAFGASVVVLPNGNFVVTDPLFSPAGSPPLIGAVYLYGPDGTLISTLTGSSAEDAVGDGGIVVLANGNFVVRSSGWDNGAEANAGAVTFVSGTTGLSGAVSASNSLVGSRAGSQVGTLIFALPNGNYLVLSPQWSDGTRPNLGAATFGLGTTGVSGPVSDLNSLLGKQADDRVGSGATVLANGNYLVLSPGFDLGMQQDVGAVTFGSGTTGVRGSVDAANSLVGRSAFDRVGAISPARLPNGNYVVRAPRWDNEGLTDAGAVVFGSGTSGVSGLVSRSNALVGTRESDRVGSATTLVLANGNFVVLSPFWNNGDAVDAGAATFASGVSGIVGTVSPTNSLVGSTADDRVGSRGLALANGNFVIVSALWDSGVTANVGAATFGSGTAGPIGPVSPTNSLVGTSIGDEVGSMAVVLTNGNYVIGSRAWDAPGTPNVGAVAVASGTTGLSGVVSSSNSLVGTTAEDQIGSTVIALPNGGFVMASTSWDNGSVVDAGAVTHGSGSVGAAGVLTASNSLVGSSPEDRLGSGGIFALSNGNYVVSSPEWDSESAANVGAVTFGPGSTGIVGTVSPANSLVGTRIGDRVGGERVAPIRGGNYVVVSSEWDANDLADAGAITFGSGVSGTTGPVSATNSIIGGTAQDFLQVLLFAYDNGNFVLQSDTWDNGLDRDVGATTLGLANGSVVGPITSTHSVLGNRAGSGDRTLSAYDQRRNQLVVGNSSSNRVVLHRTGAATTTTLVGDTPDPAIVGTPVTFRATVSSAPPLPADGRVTFTAASGETCTGSTPTQTSASTVDFSCTMVFANAGTTTVVAEYLGSIVHAFSSSAPESHTTLPRLFDDGFESR